MNYVLNLMLCRKFYLLFVTWGTKVPQHKKNTWITTLLQTDFVFRFIMQNLDLTIIKMNYSLILNLKIKLKCSIGSWSYIICK